MKRNASPYNYYAFRFSPVHVIVAVLVFLLCAASVVWTTVLFVPFVKSGDLTNVYEWLKYLIPYFVSLLFAVLATGILVRSRYGISDDSLLMQFGFIRQRYEIKKIFSVHIFRGSNKLAVYFDDFKTDYLFIVIKDSLFGDFVKDLCSRNEKIVFTYSTSEEEDEAKRDKK